MKDETREAINTVVNLAIDSPESFRKHVGKMYVDGVSKIGDTDTGTTFMTDNLDLQIGLGSYFNGSINGSFKWLYEAV